MRSCFDPKHLAMAALLLAATAASGATAPAATGASAAPSSSSTSDVSVSRVTFSAIQDQASKGNWMMIEVDVQGRSTNKTIINDLTVTLTLGWAGDPIDLPLTSTVKLIGVFNGKQSAVLFFVPPETLARSSKGLPYDASRTPDFFAIEMKIGENDAPMNNYCYPPKLMNAERAKNFATKAQGSAEKGLMFSQATVPSYILTQAITKVTSYILPTSASPDAGH